ncbi:MAG: RNA polymerase sigma factor, partial [Pseudomonadales bacterium]
QRGIKMDNPPSYIYKVALTTGLAMVERAKKQRVIARDLEMEDSAPSAQDAKLTERARLIEELLAQLQTDQADALRAYLAGYNHGDIAKLFSWTESVARHKVYRSIDKLRDFMREHDIDEVTDGG